MIVAGKLLGRKRMARPRNLVAVAMLLAMISGEAGHAASSGEMRLTEMRVANLRLLDKDGISPQWSPDGRRLLFLKAGSVWIVNADGKGKFRLLAGPVPTNLFSWSQDGKRIAFVRCNRSNCSLMVYDLQKKKEYSLQDLREAPNGLAWTKEGNIVWQFGAITYGQVPAEVVGLNIDDLKPLTGSFQEDDKDGFPRIAAHAHSAHFGYRGFDGLPFALEISGDWMTLGGGPVWARTQDSSYALLVDQRNCDNAALSPDSRTVAMSRAVRLRGDSGGIYLADLETGRAWNKWYRLPGGSEQGLAVGSSLRVCRKKLNPLNGKVVGADTSVCGAMVTARKVEAEHSLVEVVKWTGTPLPADDVVVLDENDQTKVLFLGKAVKAEPDDGDRQKADDARRAMVLNRSGVEHYRKGYVDTGLSELREAYQLDSENQFIRRNLGLVLNNVGVQRYQAGNRDGGLSLVKEACGLGIEEGCRAAEKMGR